VTLTREHSVCAQAVDTYHSLARANADLYGYQMVRERERSQPRNMSQKGPTREGETALVTGLVVPKSRLTVRVLEHLVVHGPRQHVTVAFGRY